MEPADTSDASPRIEPSTARRLREIVEHRAGLVIDARKEEALAAAVHALARQHGLGGEDAVLRAVETDASGAAAFHDLVAHLRVGETYFFRNRPHFRALRDVVLPELLEAAESKSRRLTIWSAGCSTGEEAWSLVMTLADVAAARGTPLGALDARVIGTDLDTGQLEKAREGVYESYSFRGVSDDERERHFDRIEPAGDEGVRWRVQDRHRRFVRFEPGNLVADRFPDPARELHDLDLIVCRNVTIYFSSETTRRLADRFHATLREGGYLLVGHSEHSLETYRAFETRALPEVVLYQRGGDEPRAAVAPGASWLPRPGAERRPPPRSRRLSAADVPLADESSPSRGDAECAELVAAREALDRGDLNAAVAESIAVLETDPNDAAACRLLGRVAADRGHGREAEIWLQRATDIAPLDPEAHYLLAILAADRGDTREALRRVDRATYLEPDLIVAHHLRSRLQASLGLDRQSAHSAELARRLLTRLAPDEEVPLSQGLTARQLTAVLGRLR